MIDVLVVGGGPVGLATALYARRAGLSVTVVEPRHGPIDKACGEGLMPGALAALTDLGVLLDGRPFRGIRYTDGRRSVDGLFVGPAGLGVRRTELQASLRQAVDAADCGYEAVPFDATAIEQDERSVHAGGFSARYLVAADGLHSSIRRAVGLDKTVRSEERYGLRCHFPATPWTDLVEVHWSPDREAYVTPVSDALIGVAILTSQRGSFAEHLAEFPALQERLSTVPTTRVRGAGPLRQRSRARAHGRVLLVGDAAGYVDALTGEGIAVGLASARVLVGCISRDQPGAYEREWLHASRRYRWLTGSLLWARNQRPLAARIVPAAHRLPRVFTAAVRQLAR